MIHHLLFLFLHLFPIVLLQYLLLGISSSTFRWSRRKQRFYQTRPLPWPQLLVDEFLFVGAAVKKMEAFVGGEPARGKILRAFVDALNQILRSCPDDLLKRITH